MITLPIALVIGIAAVLAYRHNEGSGRTVLAVTAALLGFMLASSPIGPAINNAIDGAVSGIQHASDSKAN